MRDGLTTTITLQTILGHPQTNLIASTDEEGFFLAAKSIRGEGEYRLRWCESQVGVYSIQRVFEMLVRVSESPEYEIEDELDQVSLSDGFRGFWWSAFLKRRQGRVRLIFHLEKPANGETNMFAGYAVPEELLAFAKAHVERLSEIDDNRQATADDD